MARALQVHARVYFLFGRIGLLFSIFTDPQTVKNGIPLYFSSFFDPTR